MNSSSRATVDNFQARIFDQLNALIFFLSLSECFTQAKSLFKAAVPVI